MALMKKMKLKFVKMQGAGNDFVVIDNRKYGFTIEQLQNLSPNLCNRKFGIGADGLMALNESQIPEAQFEMIYRNADGSDAGMCGNGGRCMALFASKNGFGTRQTFHVHQVVYRAKVESKHQQVQLHFPIHPEIQKRNYDGYVDYYQVYTGTDHIVIPVADKEQLAPQKLIGLARDMRNSSSINERGTNVNFFVSPEEQKKLDEPIRLETFERGVEDFTLACGTGAIATALTDSYLKNESDDYHKKVVQCAGGKLHIGFKKNQNTFSEITLSGEAKIVFSGEVLIELE